MGAAGGGARANHHHRARQPRGITRAFQDTGEGQPVQRTETSASLKNSAVSSPAEPTAEPSSPRIAAGDLLRRRARAGRKSRGSCLPHSREGRSPHRFPSQTSRTRLRPESIRRLPAGVFIRAGGVNDPRTTLSPRPSFRPQAASSRRAGDGQPSMTGGRRSVPFLSAKARSFRQPSRRARGCRQGS